MTKKVSQHIGPLISLLTLLIIFIIYYGAANLWMKYYASPVVHAKLVLNVHPKYGWYQIPNLKTSFYNSSLITNSEGQRIGKENISTGKGKTILVLGPSSAFGWGVDFESTYGNKLTQLMTAKTGGPWQVINLSGIGHSVIQGQKILEDVTPLLHPDLIILAYGINDLDRFRFYFQSNEPDRMMFDHLDEKSLYQDSSPAPYAISQFAYELQNQIRSRFFCQKIPIIDEFPNLRTPLSEFAKEWKDLIKMAQKFNVPIVTLGTTSSFPKKARPTSLSADEYFAKAHRAQVNGDCHEYRENLTMALELESSRIEKDLIVLNREEQKIAQEMNLLHLDLEEVFANKKTAEYFLDPVHFTEKGHDIIAQRIFEKFSQ
ncbi:MAG: hypothetical protein OHK0056_30280 [Bacteriovoracaceae bacterium]